MLYTKSPVPLQFPFFFATRLRLPGSSVVSHIVDPARRQSPSPLKARVFTARPEESTHHAARHVRGVMRSKNCRHKKRDLHPWQILTVILSRLLVTSNWVILCQFCASELLQMCLIIGVVGLLCWYVKGGPKLGDGRKDLVDILLLTDLFFDKALAVNESAATR